MDFVVIYHNPYDFSGPLIDYFQRWRKLIQDPSYINMVYYHYEISYGLSPATKLEKRNVHLYLEVIIDFEANTFIFLL